ncbi:Leucine rich repeat N-terminal domain [Seminavis robusta]|uniref:Leucine rich repeat N-terminal domain n=1 Tax=Seminavis robusta TaxID=568900 RepID=A0A9N8HHP7_9STRA|nr:Leucine rich repeat N-terminal domain [Seminavis robusta]|eukprot:Sro575_g169330.1 Leucine rich repeat N-terminal domain (499) ;mRNA; r:25742-27363
MLEVRISHSEETVAFQPAAGYYVCPEEDMVCNIRGCTLEGGCDRFMLNFIHVPHVLPNVDEEVYVSTGPHASITLGYGDADMIICDLGCTCQPLVDDGSCHLLVDEDEELSATITPSVYDTEADYWATTYDPSTLPPTEFPTWEPTMAPTITRTLAEVLYEASGDIIYQPGTPQFQAMRWLQRRDNYYDYYYDTTTTTTLLQRYALVALDFAFHDNDPRRLTWTDPNTDECYWDGVTCAYFGGVAHVRTINWARRGLSGSVLRELSLLPALETLDLAQNYISGSLDTFYSLRFLKNLYLFENHFSGRIRNRISQLNRLERLYLGKNELTGSLPIGLWQNNTDRPLQWLILHHNQLSGTVPEGMRLGHLRYLDLSNNEFQSTIPSDWPSRLITLRTLYLDHNHFYGTIPSDFPAIGKGWLKQLYLNDNDLTGPFPRWGDYPQVPIWYLTNIDIRNNRISRVGSNVCSMSVFDKAEMVELRADCRICNCRRLCDNCDDEK